ncbi:MAG: hypothetical protein AAF386_11635 [Pseudomonadota bacterium]
MTDELDPITYAVALFGAAELTWWDPEPLPPKGQAALDQFLALKPSDLDVARRHLFAFYQDTVAQLFPEDLEHVPTIERAADVLAHITVSGISVETNWDSDGSWYVGVTGNVTWDPEHGLAMYWEDGRHLTKVGGFDGHVSNANAMGDPKMKDVVYRATDPQFRTDRD